MAPPAQDISHAGDAVFTDTARAEELKNAGNQRLKEKDYAGAEALYSQAIEICPQTEAYFQNRALVRTTMAKYSEAIDDCQSALAINPASSKAYGRMGKAYFSASDFQNSVRAYEKALELDPSNATYEDGMRAAKARLAPPSDAGGAPSATTTSDVSGTAAAMTGLLNSLAASSAAPTGLDRTGKVQDASVDMGMGMARSAKAMQLFNEVKADYEQSLLGVPEDDPAQQAAVLAPVHERSAKKCLQLAMDNGGIYNKAAQFVASLQGGAGDRGVPIQYVKTLQVLTDNAPFRPFSAMQGVFAEEFGRTHQQLFRSVQETPIAAASLAQVHVAETREGERVAVKILYPTLRKELASDFAVFRMMGSQIKPGGYDLQWVVNDFEEAMKMELDLESEARNARQAAHDLRRRKDVKVPRILDGLTCSSVLTMELEEGLIKVNDAPALRANSLDPAECGELLSSVFAEMALVHGHVHGDPHAGNVYLQVDAGAKRKGTPKLVVLDHGLYHTVPETMRRDLCRLLLAQVSPWASLRTKERLARRFAGPLFKYFPLILSPWFIFGASLTAEDVVAAKKQQLPESVSVRDVGECLLAMHGQQEGDKEGGNMLGVLHSLGYTRGLLNSLAFPERKRLKGLIKYAQIGLFPAELRDLALSKGVSALPLRNRLQIFQNGLYVDILALLLPVLLLFGRFIFLVELLRWWLGVVWWFGGLNPLAWEPLAIEDGGGGAEESAGSRKAR